MLIILGWSSIAAGYSLPDYDELPEIPDTFSYHQVPYPCQQDSDCPTGGVCQIEQCYSAGQPVYIDYRYATNMTRSAVGFFAQSADPVPEPASIAVLGLGLAAVVALRRKRSV